MEQDVRADTLLHVLLNAGRGNLLQNEDVSVFFKVGSLLSTSETESRRILKTSTWSDFASSVEQVIRLDWRPLGKQRGPISGAFCFR